MEYFPVWSFNEIPHPWQDKKHKCKNLGGNKGCNNVQVYMQSIICIHCPVLINVTLPPHPSAPIHIYGVRDNRKYNLIVVNHHSNHNLKLELVDICRHSVKEYAIHLHQTLRSKGQRQDFHICEHLTFHKNILGVLIIDFFSNKPAFPEFSAFVHLNCSFWQSKPSCSSVCSRIVTTTDEWFTDPLSGCNWMNCLFQVPVSTLGEVT